MNVQSRYVWLFSDERLAPGVSPSPATKANDKVPGCAHGAAPPGILSPAYGPREGSGTVH